MSITPLPALDRLSATFKAEADAFFSTALPKMTAELNAELERINTIGSGTYTATSATSLTIGVGSKSLTITTGKSFGLGQAVVIAQTSTPTNYMVGQVTAHDPDTGALTVNVTAVGGSGTAASWTISVAALVAPAAVSPDSIVVLTSGTSWTNSGGWTKCKLRANGGGGGAARRDVSYPGGAGAAGGYTEKLFSITPGNSYSYTIGTGGAAATTDGANGTAGGSTTFNTGAVTITCGGGGGGSTTSTGGAAANGDVNITGESGFLAISTGGSTAGGRSPIGYGSGGFGKSGTGDAGKDGVIILELYK